MDVFFGDDDHEAYLDPLIEFGRKNGVKYLGYCLMSNHAHLVAVCSFAPDPLVSHGE